MRACPEADDMLLARAIGRAALGNLGFLVLETEGGAIEIARSPEASRIWGAPTACQPGAPARSRVEPGAER